MEIPTLFYREGTCALGSMITAEWTGLPYQLCRLSHAEQDSDGFLKINPLGEVPVIKVGRTFLTESFAILQHLALQHRHHGREIHLTFAYGDALFDKMNEVLSYLVSDFHKSFAPLFQSDATRELKHRVLAGPLLEQMNFVDRYLVNRGLIFGKPTIADAYLYGTVRWANNLYDIPNEFPAIANFQAIMNDDPAVQFAIAIEKEKPAKTTGMFLEHIELKKIVDFIESDAPGLQMGNVAAAAEADQARGDGAAML